MSSFIRDTLDALFELEQQVVAIDDKLGFETWQPKRRPTGDLLWNWIVPEDTSADWPDASRHRDVITVRATIGVSESGDDKGQVDRLLELTDKFLDVVDPALHDAASRPWLVFPGCHVQAQRTSMGVALYPWGDQAGPVLAMDFPIRLQLDRNTFG